ncbi:RimK family alpha-L-glutamate ligase [Pseudomonas sp. NPDC088368]|jgi:ribosomal protein S6--L-glutamate ligase|uniref:ATP-grasp domain-containing protein n=1 Tax=Pseudomonas sp. NPDC088368 TaxID=3364453 RepID=UPI003818CD0D
MKASTKTINVAIWMYQNDNGRVPLNALRTKLEEKGANVFSEFDLRTCYALNGKVYTASGVNLSKFDFLFHMNADEQSDHQRDMLKAIEEGGTAVLNDCSTFFACQDKFVMNNMLRSAGINVPESLLFCKSIDQSILKNILHRWRSWLIKPRKGHGAKGIVKFCDCEQFIDFIEAMTDDNSGYYIEQFIEFGERDFRVEIFNENVIGGYSRIKSHDFKTNISAGGRMAPSEMGPEVEIALNAAKALGVTGTIVDMVKGINDHQFYVLEVNPTLGIFVESAMMAGTRMPPQKAHESYAYDDAKVDEIVKYIFRPEICKS